uniref:protein moonraker isoform X2 n=1 Tax=Doryrhamphus excisus TaxID=161450 RepID=UPI0025AEAFCA|nr:protein moonraker isoform X2 [Doryrhamphus excisus]
MISIGQQTNEREWVVLPSSTHSSGYLSTGTSQTQLLFNEAVPASVNNRATVVGPPSPIVIEKLLPLSGEQEKGDSIKSLLSFSSLSEEKLQAAVNLAKRDLRRRRFNTMYKSPADISISDTIDVALPQEITTSLSLKERLTRPASKCPVDATRKCPVASKPSGRLLPTSRHPVCTSMGGADQHVVLRQEIRMLQNELENLKKGRDTNVNRKERVNLLAARQPQGTPKKSSRSLGGHPHSVRPPVQKQREAAHQQNIHRQELFALPSELEHSESAYKQNRATHLSGGYTPKQSAEDTSKKPYIASMSSSTQDYVVAGQQNLLSQEMHKLDEELENIIHQVESLSDRKGMESLEPDELKKFEVRWQNQAVHSARTIYGLQQQIRETQQYIEKLHNQDIWEAKKSTAIQRLAGAHRGTLKALQVIVHQLSEQFYDKLPSHCKELSRLICQLSLCSAKIQVEPGAAMPETAVNILKKLEILDSAISKHEMLQKQKMQDQACPSQKKSSYPSLSSTRAPKGQGRAHRSANGTNPTRHVQAQRMAAQKQRGPQRPAQQRALEELRISANKNKKGGAPQHEKNKSHSKMLGNQKPNAHFRQPTVSSRLRVNQPPQRESSVPWIPASLHTVSPPRSHQKMSPEPRCLSSPAKPSSSSPVMQKVTLGSAEEADLSLENKRQAQNETLRGAWLDKITTQRLNELNQLSQEEVERIKKLRAEVVSPSQWAVRAEQEAREKIQPLLDEAKNLGEFNSRSSTSLRNKLSEQAVKRVEGNAEKLSEALLDDLLEDAERVAWSVKMDEQLEGVTRRMMQAPTLESMLRRMEEIQKDQEEVRRRFTSIAYSDPIQWRQPADSQVQVSGSRPSSPQPIRLTKLVLRQPETANIVLEKPVETGVLSESSLTEETPQEEQQPVNGVPIFPAPKEQSTGTVISVPGSMLRSIRRYRDDYDTYLCDVAHEAGGGFNSWSIADSLADELLWDAVADVAAEFQDVMEECAEAVFTCEFLQMIQSPTASSSAVVIQ